MRSRASRVRVGVRVLSAFCLLSSIAFGSTRAAVATTVTQPNGCFSPIQNNWSAFAIPISATPSEATIASGGSVELTGLGIVFGVDSTLIAAGVATGLVSSSDDPNAPAANFVEGEVSLVVDATNSVAGTGTATGTVQLTFYVYRDPNTFEVTVFEDPNGTQPIAGSLDVAVPLADLQFDHDGGGTPMAFAEQTSVPSSLSLPTLADRDAAPLIVRAKISSSPTFQPSVTAPFYCWPGSADEATNQLVPATASTIATVEVTGSSSTTTTTTSSSSTTTAPTSSTTTTAPSSTTTTAPSSTTTTAPTSSTTTTAPLPTTQRVARTYVTDCTNTIQPGVSNLTFAVAGTVPTQATTGDPLALTDQTWTVTVPGSILDAGLALGLLQPGETISAVVVPSIVASNTAEAAIATSPVTIAVGPITVDSTTGVAHDVDATLAVPDLAFTPIGGDVALALGQVTFNVQIGALEVAFTCDPQSPVPRLTTIPVTGAAIPTTTTTAPTTAAPTTSPTVTAATTPGATTTTTTTSTAATLPVTGPGAPWLLVGLALALVDIGYLVTSAFRRPRVRI